MTAFIGACISALAIACSKARDTSRRDLSAHHEVWIISCQCGSCAGIFHRLTPPFIPMELSALIILFSMSRLSSSYKLVQSCMKGSITRARNWSKESKFQTVPLPIIRRPWRHLTRPSGVVRRRFSSTMPGWTPSNYLPSECSATRN